MTIKSSEQINYDEMSDAQINKAIAHKLGVVLFMGIKDNGCGDLAPVTGGTVNYCNHPSDAWPIIIDNHISISHEMARYSASSLVYDKKYEKGFNIFKHDGPMADISSNAALRAAMICFLKMKDDEK